MSAKSGNKTYSTIKEVLVDLQAGELKPEAAEILIRKLRPQTIVVEDEGGGGCRY